VSQAELGFCPPVSSRRGLHPGPGLALVPFMERRSLMSDPYVRVDVWSLAEDDPVITAYADAVAAMMRKDPSDPTSWTFQAVLELRWRRPEQQAATRIPRHVQLAI
jgi:hypothetical protein